jgi:regulator of protease activity HflC (stomatin/prohibitin superfamily)
MSPQAVKKIISFLKYVLVGIFLIYLIANMVFVIGPGERGILMTWGDPQMVAYTEGIHFKIPIAQTVARIDVKTRKYEATATAASKDLQDVTTKIAVNYHPTPEAVPKLFKEIGLDYQVKVIEPATQEAVKAVTAQFAAEQLITQRPVVKEQIKEKLKVQLIERGIYIEEISITDFQFSASFNAAIEQKVTAEQLKLKAEKDLQRIEVEAQQREAEAIGKKQAAIAEAEGNAKAIELEAEARAKAIRLIDDQLRQSDSYIEYIKAQKWDGKLPVYVTAGAPYPMLDVTAQQTSQA